MKHRWYPQTKHLQNPFVKVKNKPLNPHSYTLNDNTGHGECDPLKLRSQPAVRLFCPYVFLEATFARFFKNVRRGKSREDARHTHDCAMCEYVARTQRLGVSGCVYRRLLRWSVSCSSLQRTIS